MPKTIISLEELGHILNPSERILALQAERDQIAEAYKEYKVHHGQIQQLLSEVLASIPAIDPLPIQYEKKEAKVHSDCAVVLHVTDTHHGAIQDEDEIEGFGKFSPDISRNRQYGFVKDVLEWSDLHRSGYSIPKCQFLVTGDLISGDIQDLRVTNAFPSPRQAVEAAEILAKQISMVSPFFQDVTIDFVTLDNHGRLTKKPQAKEGGYNNWMYIVAYIAKMLIREIKNVTFNVWPMYQKLVTVCGRRYLICHGHDISGWAGFPYYGIDRKASKEALKRMNSSVKNVAFDKIIMGHWHAPLEHPYWWIGGAVSGTDAYDHIQGRHAEPQQVSWLVHPKWGEFDRTCWGLKKYDKDKQT